MKKTLAIILTLALVICMMPASMATAYAADSLTADIAATEALYTSGNITLPAISNVKLGNQVLSQGGSADNTYTLSWEKSDGSSITGGVVKEAGVYIATITANNNEKTSIEKTFTVIKVDATKAQVTYNGFFEKTQNGPYAVDPTKLVVKQGNYVVNSSLYTTTTDTTVRSGYVRINVAIAESDNNVNSGTIFVDVPIKISLKNNYQIKYNASTQAIPDQVYDGRYKTPSFVVVRTNSADSTLPATLTQGTHYAVKYDNNLNAGQNATITVTGMGDFSNAVADGLTATFSIVGKNIGTASGMTFSVSTAAVNETPDVTVKDGTKELTKAGGSSADGDYYIYSCSSSVEGLNQGSITLQGKGNYTGTKTIPFTVVSKNKEIGSAKFANSSSNYSVTSVYNGSNQTPSIVATLTDGTTITSGFDIVYKKDGKTVTAMKDAGIYNVSIVGKSPYAGTKPVGTYTITPFSLDYTELQVGSATVLYNGRYLPKILVRPMTSSYGYNNFYFEENKDYKVAYYNYDNKYASSYFRPYAVVTPIAGSNLTTGKEATKKIEFSVTTRSLNNCTINFSDYRSSSAYTGKSITPKVTVKDTSLNYTLREGAAYDYTITYKNSAGKVVSSLIDAGTYSVIVEGKGAYSGSQTLTYTIAGTDIGNYTVTLKESSVTADGRTKTPVITSVSYGYYSKLSSSDYTVSYQDSTGKEVKSYQMSTPGTYKVVVTGKNGYTGSCYATFTIVGLSQSITGVDGSYKVYPTSETFRLYPKATEGRFTYTSSDPSVASVDAFGNVTPYKAGRAKITISTTGNVRYNPVTTSTVIKVYPNKAAMTRKPWTAGKGKIKVRWNKQDNVTRYEVRYSKNKSFKKGTYKTKKVNAAVNAYTTQSTTLSGLNSGYTYYVKVRAVKEVYNDYGKKLTYYGKWSGWRSVRVK